MLLNTLKVVLNVIGTPITNVNANIQLRYCLRLCTGITTLFKARKVYPQCGWESRYTGEGKRKSKYPQVSAAGLVPVNEVLGRNAPHLLERKYSFVLTKKATLLSQRGLCLCRERPILQTGVARAPSPARGLPLALGAEAGRSYSSHKQERSLAKGKSHADSQPGSYLCRQRPYSPTRVWRGRPRPRIGSSTIGPAGLNLRRLEGVSGIPQSEEIAGAFCRSPEHREVSLKRSGSAQPKIPNGVKEALAGVESPREKVECPFVVDSTRSAWFRIQFGGRSAE